MDTSSVTNMNGTFIGCTSLTTIPQMDTSSVTNMLEMFSGCTSLTTIPRMDTSSVTNMAAMFNGCTSLTTIPQMDMSSVTNISNTYNMFSGCSNLTNLDLRNIKMNLQIGSGTSWGHLLTVDSLVNTIKELVTSPTPKTLTMGTDNVAKIQNLYCKIIDDTDPKKTMELCESTEEGAMTLTDYAQLKKWNIR